MAETARHTDRATTPHRTGGDAKDDIIVENLTPANIVRELDLHIIGQDDAKRAVAVALRNRYRRRLLPDELREEIHPRNILMIGPTGVGKTEIARRVAKMVDAPFLKVEATKFTEVGYVGRDVESIVRDLVEVAISNLHNKRMDEVREQASQLAEERLADLVTEQMLSRKPVRNESRRQETDPGSEGDADARKRLTEQRRLQRERKRTLRLLQEHALDEETIEIDIEYDDFGEFDPGEFGDDFGDDMHGTFRDFLDSLMPRRPTRRKVSVREAERILTQQEAYRMVDAGSVIDDAILRVEESGVIFLDEIDKTISSGNDYGGDVSGEGVQRDLLPIVEGSVVMTRYGPVKTDHVLFIAAGSFHDTRPSDLIPELQGRFPIRVELSSLDEDDLYRILTEPRNALTRQYEALLATERVELAFTDGSLREMARLATLVNGRTEDIGARRLQTIFEKVLEEISFSASDRPGERIVIEEAFVTERVGEIAVDDDLSNFIL
ncbi:MAG TPA: ATP-dependent protease ATPase subunit HslU [Thermomicrobiales bacterium]|nr:ATP-dependent protease ATPase subunit HslU [Thermomicrobiales bacterium]